MNEKKLMNRAADNIRILAASMVEKANSGHPGGAMGGADFVNVLFSEFLVYDPENPRWEGRDRFFLDLICPWAAARPRRLFRRGSYAGNYRAKTARCSAPCKPAHWSK